MRLFDRLVDLSLLFLAPFSAPFLYVAARKRSTLRLTRKFQDFLGVTVVRNHYYEPVFTDRDLKRAPEQVRDLPGLDLNIPKQLEILDSFIYSEELKSLEKKSIAGKEFFYGGQRGIFAEGDAEALYCFVRHYKPNNVIEIGSGQSSVVIELAIQKNMELNQEYKPNHVCFEPFENPWLETIGAVIRREKIECADLSIFDNLSENDIVFIDSTHSLRPQGDIECEILRILPILNPGVLVHFHDVFTPRDYTRHFLVDERNFWTEQYLLEAFLSLNPHYEIILSLHHLHQLRESKLYEAFPMLAQNPDIHPGSFWIRRRAV